MPLRNENYRCTCYECLENGEVKDGIRIGKLIPVVQKSAHLARVRKSHANVHSEMPAGPIPETASRSFRTSASDLVEDELANNIFKATLTDNGPNFDDQLNRLWGSEPRTGTDHSHSESTLNVGDLIEGIRGLDIASPLSDIEFSDNPVTPSNTPLHIDDHLHSSTADALTPMERLIRSRGSEKERHRSTKKAHQILNKVDERIRECVDSIKEPANGDVLRNAEDQYGKISLTLKSCTRKVPSVTEKKACLEGRLAELGQLIAARRENFAEELGPTSYNSGGYYITSLLCVADCPPRAPL
jgi:hypothetical protein